MSCESFKISQLQYKIFLQEEEVELLNKKLIIILRIKLIQIHLISLINHI
jgi:hypothetical protein